jgi:hypothetical protein
MPSLYNDYCFPSLSAVLDSVKSKPILENGDILQSATISGSSIFVNVQGSNDFLFTPPSCSTVGNYTSYTGLSLVDSTELAWLVVLVLVAAFSIKMMKRGL